MLTSSLSKIAFAALTSVLLLGCASGNRIPATSFTTYEDFRAGPEGGVDLVWARVGLRTEARLKKKLAQYDSVVIDRIYVLTSEDNALDDDQINELTAYFIARLKEKITAYKPIVDTPGENSLRLSFALSNVETPNPILAVTSSLLPVGLGISTISKITTGEHTNVGGATVELLVSDAKTDRPLFAVIDRETGNKDLATMIDSLDDAKDAINWWVERLGKALDGNFEQE
ncbi:DUF3313 domain-containing protein [Enterovibrio norvegicus]|uniref:DUF3313 domain-containing protein n=1 Tax=Enterovibrio norvegicus TaxID=188144 RepID=A0A2N7LD90_9GAMM|nr:DUF3313 domain-containing protein [Enterovibrio norvegicus]PML81556.1 hypothetical protein BCT69_07680 [Enterovibrio norvegicus]PMN66494.1 hypothetical protein BCT27_06465 [Enterovibrio norvegicus]PMN93351.1 hypothetical protein BCT23_13135 [Enterovibrio norvegicus]